ncbi:uncharacterized protein LOC115057390 [Echeneis naucrates]|uniref:uncharacterized protein LOC115057390 n=1 Tax=Echeneis naucrates TaxID=173247 RepID=UPI0011143674|nr:uncharacterized protein LOC115057390 [Echeneis naucrates]
MDDDVFMDGTLREVEEKMPDFQEEVSERSILKVSPGSVRQEVSQAITDKKGMLIILKEAEDKVDTEGSEMSFLDEKKELILPREAETEENDLLSASKEEETFKEDGAVVTEAQTTVVKTLSPKIEIKTDDMGQIKATDSPKKAMASWISEEVKPAASEVFGVSAKEFREMKMCGGLQQSDEIFTFEEVQSKQSKSSLTQITVSESSASTLAVVLYEN